MTENNFESSQKLASTNDSEKLKLKLQEIYSDTSSNLLTESDDRNINAGISSKILEQAMADISKTTTTAQMEKITDKNSDIEYEFKQINNDFDISVVMQSLMRLESSIPETNAIDNDKNLSLLDTTSQTKEIAEFLKGTGSQFQSRNSLSNTVAAFLSTWGKNSPSPRQSIQNSVSDRLNESGPSKSTLNISDVAVEKVSPVSVNVSILDQAMADIYRDSSTNKDKSVVDERTEAESTIAGKDSVDMSAVMQSLMSLESLDNQVKSTAPKSASGSQNSFLQLNSSAKSTRRSSAYSLKSQSNHSNSRINDGTLSMSHHSVRNSNDKNLKRMESFENKQIDNNFESLVEKSAPETSKSFRSSSKASINSSQELLGQFGATIANNMPITPHTLSQYLGGSILARNNDFDNSLDSRKENSQIRTQNRETLSNRSQSPKNNSLSNIKIRNTQAEEELFALEEKIENFSSTPSENFHNLENGITNRFNAEDSEINDKEGNSLQSSARDSIIAISEAEVNPTSKPENIETNAGNTEKKPINYLENIPFNSFQGISKLPSDDLKYNPYYIVANNASQLDLRNNDSIENVSKPPGENSASLKNSARNSITSGKFSLHLTKNTKSILSTPPENFQIIHNNDRNNDTTGKNAEKLELSDKQEINSDAKFSVSHNKSTDNSSFRNSIDSLKNSSNISASNDGLGLKLSQNSSLKSLIHSSQKELKRSSVTVNRDLNTLNFEKQSKIPPENLYESLRNGARNNVSTPRNFADFDEAKISNDHESAKNSCHSLQLNLSQLAINENLNSVAISKENISAASPKNLPESLNDSAKNSMTISKKFTTDFENHSRRESIDSLQSKFSQSQTVNNENLEISDESILVRSSKNPRQIFTNSSRNSTTSVRNLVINSNDSKQPTNQNSNSSSRSSSTRASTQSVYLSNVAANQISNFYARNIEMISTTPPNNPADQNSTENSGMAVKRPATDFNDITAPKNQEDSSNARNSIQFLENNLNLSSVTTNETSEFDTVSEKYASTTQPSENPDQNPPSRVRNYDVTANKIKIDFNGINQNASTRNSIHSLQHETSESNSVTALYGSQNSERNDCRAVPTSREITNDSENRKKSSLNQSSSLKNSIYSLKNLVNLSNTSTNELTEKKTRSNKSFTALFSASDKESLVSHVSKSNDIVPTKPPPLTNSIKSSSSNSSIRNLSRVAVSQPSLSQTSSATAEPTIATQANGLRNTQEILKSRCGSGSSSINTGNNINKLSSSSSLKQRPHLPSKHSSKESLSVTLQKARSLIEKSQEALITAKNESNNAIIAATAAENLPQQEKNHQKTAAVTTTTTAKENYHQIESSVLPHQDAVAKGWTPDPALLDLEYPSANSLKIDSTEDFAAPSTESINEVPLSTQVLLPLHPSVPTTGTIPLKSAANSGLKRASKPSSLKGGRNGSNGGGGAQQLSSYTQINGTSSSKSLKAMFDTHPPTVKEYVPEVPRESTATGRGEDSRDSGSANAVSVWDDILSYDLNARKY
ncbi:hypothetical protein HK100_006539 [Physocladia obscura]|uniref:Uncharacterized protein n=1 Tax=Physocladia obscura TaxID=109957 RepID=A0AAD5T681_9FUNG|nr:hypothetical protein HK100_006539 [Physocladia obscura]